MMSELTRIKEERVHIWITSDDDGTKLEGLNSHKKLLRKQIKKITVMTKV